MTKALDGIKIIDFTHVQAVLPVRSSSPGTAPT